MERVRPPVVVIGLASVVGLQTARVFAARGVEVVGVVGDLGHFAARTRVCRRVVRADVFGDDLVDRLEALGRELSEAGSRAVLVPCTDSSALRVSKSRERLEPWFHVPLAGYDTLLQLADKGRFAEVARGRGLAVPATMVLHSRADAERAAAELALPVVLKPTVKSSDWEVRAGGKALIVRTAEELLGQFDRLRPWTTRFVAQEYVEGADAELFTVNGYFDRGRPLCVFSTRKQRQWPPHTGTASYAREARNDAVVAAAIRLFGDPGFTGLGYLEAKRDPGTGVMKVIEANVGRPTGRSATAEAGGVELLWTMYCHASGQPLPPPGQRVQRFRGAAWLDLRRDVLAGWYYLRRREVTVGQLLRDWTGRRTAHAVLSLRDPAPFLAEITHSLGKALRRLRRPAR